MWESSIVACLSRKQGKRELSSLRLLPLLFPPRCRHRKDRSLLLFLLRRFGNVWIFPNVFSSLREEVFPLYPLRASQKSFCLTIAQTIGRRAIANIKINLSSFCSPMIMIIVKSYQQETHLSKFFFSLIIPGQRCRRRRLRLLLRPLRLLPDPVRDQAERGPQLKRKTRAKRKRISPSPHPTLLRTYKGFSPLQSLKRRNFKGLRFETLEGPISIPTPPTNQCPSEAFEKFRCCPFTANRTTLIKHAWNSACKNRNPSKIHTRPERFVHVHTSTCRYVRHR